MQEVNQQQLFSRTPSVPQYPVFSQQQLHSYQPSQQQAPSQPSQSRGGSFSQTESQIQSLEERIQQVIKRSQAIRNDQI